VKDQILSLRNTLNEELNRENSASALRGPPTITEEGSKEEAPSEDKIQIQTQNYSPLLTN